MVLKRQEYYVVTSYLLTKYDFIILIKISHISIYRTELKIATLIEHKMSFVKAIMIKFDYSVSTTPALASLGRSIGNLTILDICLPRTQSN